jgi:hypothetical protein
MSSVFIAVTASNELRGARSFLRHWQYVQGRAMAQVLSRRPLTVEARIHALVNPFGICGGQSGSGAGFASSSSVFPLSMYHSTVALQIHIIWAMRNMLM